MCQIKWKISKYFELNKHRNTAYQYLCCVTKQFYGGLLNPYIRNKEKFQISDFNFHVKKLQKEDQLSTKYVEKRKQ